MRIWSNVPLIPMFLMRFAFGMALGIFAQFFVGFVVGLLS